MASPKATKTKMAKVLDTKPLQPSESVSGAAPSLIPNEKLVAIYVSMLRCRLLQQRVAALFQQGRLNSDLHAASGREACSAAVGVDLQTEDTLSIAAGDWLPAFAKGLPAEILLRIFAPQTDISSASTSAELQKRNILVEFNGSDQPAAVQDRAEALRSSKRPFVVAAFLQPLNNASSQWKKVVHAAAARKLPIVFVEHVVETRLSQTPSQPTRDKAPRALFHGVPTIAVDAADPVALYRVTYEAITRARQGRGATMLECAAVPIIDSVDPSTNQPLHPPDSVCIMESYMKRKGIQPDQFNRQVVAEFGRDLDLATRFLLA
jgi:TPP-dependent pyruvate/acetoin dehydrogenase alpha subunit